MVGDEHPARGCHVHLMRQSADLFGGRGHPIDEDRPGPVDRDTIAVDHVTRHVL